ncbi:hypothetical protein [Nostoc favosum]|uniref:DUF928 domain-containing protein n=1 Tax=Nostoc favosum CHAB5714 TaxID=2780399 RepID=A0ABS8IJ62_9NOSO|nr:hypothetical protein [Nostoc favosum]MCC5603808.1 hypothetical protein [Nostoc favosum CHAB5714]
MSKFKYIKTSLLLLTINIISLPSLSNSALSENPLLSWINIFFPASKPKPPIKPRKAGGRPLQGNLETTCMISPDAPEQPRVIWSTRPLFLWEGKVEKVALNKNIDTTLWSQEIKPGQNFANYTDELQPGETYYWVVFNENSQNQPSGNVRFQVMQAQQRQLINNELKALEEEYKGKGSEAIALKKTQYFVQKELWSDALQQAYSVEKPSADLRKIREEIPRKLCNFDNS